MPFIRARRSNELDSGSFSKFCLPFNYAKVQYVPRCMSCYQTCSHLAIMTTAPLMYLLPCLISRNCSSEQLSISFACQLSTNTILRLFMLLVCTPFHECLRHYRLMPKIMGSRPVFRGVGGRDPFSPRLAGSEPLDDEVDEVWLPQEVLVLPDPPEDITASDIWLKV